MALEILPGYGYLEDIRELFTEYTDMLVRRDPVFKGYLELQKYDDELLHPELKYAQPQGRLFIARLDGESVGCIALRGVDSRRCEMKRLYIRPEHRHRGVARALVARLVEEAGDAGYSQMLLDTLPVLSEAIALYLSMGFTYVERYNDSPLDYTVYMGKDL